MADPGASGVHDVPFSAGGRHAAQDARDNGTARELERGLLLAEVARDARLDRKFLLLIMLSASIATLGLLQDSPAVVIGAMLVSPLLGPIMGIGFGLATIETSLIKRSLTTLAVGVAVAVVVAMAIIALSPIQDVTAELRARTEPTLLDLAVAVVGGIAGVYAILRKLSGVMVGVAIATALVPPIATIGFGIATARLDFAGGAALLFLTNTLAIALAATVVARLNRFGPSLTPQHTAMQIVSIVVALGILAVPLAFSLDGIVREVRARSAVQSALIGILSASERVDELGVRLDGERVKVDGVVLVERYRPRLSDRVAQTSATQLGRPVDVTLAQIRQEGRSGDEAVTRLSQRITALENRDAESADLLAQLMAGGLIPRSTLTVDPQSRRVMVTRDRATEGAQVSAAFDRVIAEAQRAYPSWLIQSVAPDPGQ